MRALTAGLRGGRALRLAAFTKPAPRRWRSVPGVVGPEGLTPQPDRFVRDGDPAWLCQR